MRNSRDNSVSRLVSPYFKLLDFNLLNLYPVLLKSVLNMYSYTGTWKGE